MGAGTIRIGDPGPRPAFPGPWAIPADILEEYRARRRGRFPRGANRPSLRNTWRFRHDVLELLLESYMRYGPIFGIRIVFGYNLALIGPEANHFLLVSGRENFGWRHGRMGDLLTLDRRRPADHRRRLPRRLAGDHDARLPPRSDRRRGRDDAGRGRAGRRGAAGRRDHRRLRVGADAGDADRDESAVRLRPRLRSRRRDRRPLRERARLPRPRVPDADAVRPRHAAGEAAPRPGGARVAGRRRDRPPAQARRRRRRHPLGAARGDRRGGPLAQRPPGPRPRPHPALRRPRHGDLDGQLPGLRAGPEPGVGGPARRRAPTRSAAIAIPVPRSCSTACRC